MLKNKDLPGPLTVEFEVEDFIVQSMTTVKVHVSDKPIIAGNHKRCDTSVNQKSDLSNRVYEFFVVSDEEVELPYC